MEKSSLQKGKETVWDKIMEKIKQNFFRISSSQIRSKKKQIFINFGRGFDAKLNSFHELFFISMQNELEVKSGVFKSIFQKSN